MKYFDSLFPIMFLSFLLLSIWNLIAVVLGSITIVTFLWNYLLWLPLYYLGGGYLLFLLSERFNKVAS